MNKLVFACALGAASFTVHAQEKIPVVASFSILGDLTRAVGGDRVAVRTLVGPNGDAHVFQPSPQDAATVSSARVLVVNGLGFEGWMERLTGTTRFAGVTAVASQGVQALAADAHDHDHGHDHDHDHDHDSKKKPADKDKPQAAHAHDHSHDHHHGDTDPHAWQDPRQVKTYVTNIRTALTKADPAGATYYQERATAYLAQLDALDTWIAAQIADVPAAQRQVITSHGAFAYFAKRYGVKFLSVSGVSTDAEAAAGDVATIIRTARKEKIKAVFVENISNPRLGEQIARETGAAAGARLYSDALSPSDGPAPDYLSMMRYNTTQLVAGMRRN